MLQQAADDFLHVLAAKLGNQAVGTNAHVAQELLVAKRQSSKHLQRRRGDATLVSARICQNKLKQKIKNKHKHNL